MKFDEGRDIVNHVVGEAHVLHSLLCHASADYFVVVKRDATIIFELARARLTDVVQQCSKAQNRIRPGLWLMRSLQINRLLEHDQRVLVDILVTVMFVLFQSKQGQLGQHMRSEPGIDQQRETGARIR